MCVIVSGAAWAHCGHCEGDKAKAGGQAPAQCPAKGEAKCAGAAALAKLNLTDDQKAKIADLQKECAKATSKSECRQKCAEGLKGILTEEQFKAWEAACSTGAKASCPMSGGKSCGTK
jgi:hypothetical protein